jgi:hypothetical protein
MTQEQEKVVRKEVSAALKAHCKSDSVNNPEKHKERLKVHTNTAFQEILVML